MSFTAAALLLAWIVIGLLALVCAGLGAASATWPPGRPAPTRRAWMHEP